MARLPWIRFKALLKARGWSTPDHLVNCDLLHSQFIDCFHNDAVTGKERSRVRGAGREGPQVFTGSVQDIHKGRLME